MSSRKKIRDIAHRYFPILTWGSEYTKKTLTSDLVVAVIVTIMLIPQSLAYAQLAGLPPQIGLYASMAPLLLYAIFGTSRALSVGPVAVGSLMTAAAAGLIAAPGTPEYIGAAIALALISGLILVVMGLMRLGFIANFLSHPVISGFITASGIQIAAGQIGPMLGFKTSGHNLLELLISLGQNIKQTHLITAIIGISSLLFLFWARRGLKPLLKRLGLGARSADLIAKMGPAVAVIATTVIVWGLRLSDKGVMVVGTVPKGLPSISIPGFDMSVWGKLLVPALLISIVGYVESISVAMTLAAKRRQRIDPDQELIALGAANIGSAISGGLPVTGGFSRSVVNFDAGAETPAAGAYTAVGIAIATLFLTPLLFFLPNAVLAATIIVAVLSLVDIKTLKHTYSYSIIDFIAMVATILFTWIKGVEAGLLAGVGLSVILHLFRISKPHVAVLGQVPGTEQFLNVSRNEVVIDPEIVSLRVDASLYFLNARFLEDRINQTVADTPSVRHIILVCSAVNNIDVSALDSLKTINDRLKDSEIKFHLSEVRGPVLDRLMKSHFIEELTGGVHQSQYDAIFSINPDLALYTKMA